MNINYEPWDREAKKPGQQNPGRDRKTDDAKSTQTRKKLLKNTF